MRPASPADAQTLAQIYIDSWNEGFGHLMGFREMSAELTERWARDLASGAVEWVVAEADDAIVGFVGVGPSRDPVQPDLGEVDTIAVDPRWWRRGVGRALMDEALERLRRRFKSAIVWTVADYERGHAFYMATGWTFLQKSRAGGTEVAFGHSL